MKVNDLYNYLEAEFGSVLKREDRNDGRAYYWGEIKKAPKSTRLLRITETKAGDMAEIKLAQSSIAAGRNILLPLPTSVAELVAAVRAELSRL